MSKTKIHFLLFITALVILSVKDDYAIALNTEQKKSNNVLSEQSQEEIYLTTFKDVYSYQWSLSSIQEAVKKGYVNGYVDGTFRPHLGVTRAEFIKMLVTSVNAELGKDASKWYLPTLDAAIREGWVKTDDFKDGNINKYISRIEMAKIITRVIGQEANTNAEYMLKVVESGIISGITKGDIYTYGLMNRAQAVVIIERLLTVKEGGQLPVDTDALLTAQKAIHAGTDAWGNEIRIDTLPINYKDYHYILANFPNAGYDMPYKYSALILPSQYLQASEIKSEDLNNVKERVEKWFDLMFNLDYRTVNETWIDSLYHVMDPHGTYDAKDKDNFYQQHSKYLEWIKVNKLVSSLDYILVDMGNIAKVDGWETIKVYYIYSVLEGNKSALVWTGDANSSIFQGQTREHKDLYSTNYKMGDSVSVVSQIPLGNGDSGSFNFTDYTISGEVDLSENFVIIK